MDVPNLIKQALSDDRSAQEQLFDHYYESTLRRAYYLLKEPNDAQELAILSFQVAFANLHKFRYAGEDSFGKWLMGIVNIKAKEFRRTRVRWVEIEEDMAVEEYAEDGLAHMMDYPEVMKQISKQLDNPCIVVVLMNILYSMNHRQIAQRLNMRTGTSRQYLWRGLAQLRAQFKNH